MEVMSGYVGLIVANKCIRGQKMVFWPLCQKWPVKKRFLILFFTISAAAGFDMMTEPSGMMTTSTELLRNDGLPR